ncbi:LysR family transcriptional regulator [Kutzneria buriramensis]|uniref:DNA-binding transcriptional LysR family regulator n=1 Tax=Kutzneria buriramensis TaxID=1045776 RepID=A0A3E0H6F4_9PSEU|nr:LysR family transcriptional regulator [Kutzneria buriramensis]REH38250.1 DNA-binding transcriptional LysR family regulator [Kutzneria buriramensis]
MLGIDVVDMDELRWFIRVAESRTVTEAAETLHLSQPALSRGLGRLERELGAPLFDRVGRVLRLNANGQALLDAARRAVSAVDGARRTIGELADPDRGTVTVAFLNTMGPLVVPTLLSDYRSRRPSVQFRLRQGGTERIEQYLLDGLVDLLLISPPRSPDIVWRPLLTEPLVLVVPVTHRLAGRSSVRLAEVRDEPFVIFSKGFGMRPTTERLCREAGFSPRISCEGEDGATLRGLIGAGCGVGLIGPGPAPVPGVVELAISEPACFRTIGLGWCDRFLPAAADAFRTFALAEAKPPGMWRPFTLASDTE